jgi:hypothetical protein
MVMMTYLDHLCWMLETGCLSMKEDQLRGLIEYVRNIEAENKVAREAARIEKQAKVPHKPA